MYEKGNNTDFNGKYYVISNRITEYKTA